MMPNPFARLSRDRNEGWIGGVCAGVARTARIDPAFIRVGFVVAVVFFTKIAIGVYLVAWILMREGDD